MTHGLKYAKILIPVHYVLGTNPDSLTSHTRIKIYNTIVKQCDMMNFSYHLVVLNSPV